MTFGEKLKKLRLDNNLTQDELAEKIYVTRTAISKWETDKGYPSIESLKQLSKVFNISIDELISDSDIENKKLLEDKKARKMYYIAITFLSLGITFAVLSYFIKPLYLNIVSIVWCVLYVVFSFFSKPKYKRTQNVKFIVPYIISRILVLLILLGVIIYTIITL